MRIQQNGKLFSSALVVALILVTAGTLAAQDVRYNFMPGADFSKYHTYKWVNTGGAHPDQIMDAEIKQAIDSQLAAKGMTKTDSDEADICLAYQTAVHQERQWDVWSSRAFGMGSGSWTSSTISVGLSFLTCTTREQSSSSGLEARPTQLTPTQTTKSTRKSWTRPWRNY